MVSQDHPRHSGTIIQFTGDPKRTRQMDEIAKLRADVAALATPEGRLVGTPGHDAAEEYLWLAEWSNLALSRIEEI